MVADFRRGDRVEWKFGRGKAVGVVKKKLIARTTVGKQAVAATKDDPRYLVRTDSGKEAAKRATALRKIG